MAFTRTITAISSALAAIAMLQALALMAVMVYEVICRFGFNAPNIWAYDIAYMLSGTLFFLGAAYTLKEGGHVRIDFLAHRFPPPVTRVIEITFSAVCLLPILGAITWAVSSKAWQAFATGQTNYTSPWAPVMWPFYATIALGLACLWLQVLAQMAEQLRPHARPANPISGQ